MKDIGEKRRKDILETFIVDKLQGNYVGKKYIKYTYSY